MSRRPGAIPPIENRPGLDAISARVGTYPTFFATMKTELSADPRTADLVTRESDDFSIALLDAWAVVADVATFYCERIANEGYLRTATELRSVSELAALTGYHPAPAVAATTVVAYTIEPGGSVNIPPGTLVQSMPEPGMVPETFETSATLSADSVWNTLTPRQSRPSVIDPATTNTLYFQGAALGLKPGDPLLLVANGGQPVPRTIATVEAQFETSRTKVVLQSPPPPPPPPAAPGAAPILAAHATTPAPPSPLNAARQAIAPLSQPPATHPATPQHLVRSVSGAFRPQDDTAFGLLGALNPIAAKPLLTALAKAQVAPPQPMHVHAFSIHAPPFGNNAPKRPVLSGTGTVIGYTEWTTTRADPANPEALSIDIDTVNGISLGVTIGANPAVTGQQVSEPDPTIFAYPDGQGESIVAGAQRDNTVLILRFQRRGVVITVTGLAGPSPQASGSGEMLLSVTAAPRRNQRAPISVTGQFAGFGFAESARKLSLDTTYDTLVPGGWVMVVRPDDGRHKVPVITRLDAVAARSRGDYGLTARVTELTLDTDWIDAQDDFSVIRDTTAYAGSQELTLADEPVTDPVSGGHIELDRLVQGLKPGRWITVEGERTDVPGVKTAEVVMLAGVEQNADASRPGDTVHSFITVQAPLAFSYTRASVVIRGNVARAVHGQSNVEVLGSGNASRAFQAFALRQTLAHDTGPQPGGVEAALEIRVNDIAWSQVPNLTLAGPQDRVYALRTDGTGKTTVQFGDGVTGARLPTGLENVRAVYRVGGGSLGNVDAGKLSLLGSRPLHVMGVVNPAPATGGSDPEGIDDARRGVPLGTKSLDRLLCVQDYADFARATVGIGKALAISIPRRFRALVHVTVAGSNETAIIPGSPALDMLAASLAAFGDPDLPIEVAACRLKLVVISARVRLRDGFAWDDVQPAIRTRLLRALGFAHRDLAQAMRRSEVIALIQTVPGVSFLVLDTLTALTPDFDAAALQAIAAGAGAEDVQAALPRMDAQTRKVLPAEIAFLTDKVPAMLLLAEMAS